MSGFQGSDVDALDKIAGYTKKAADFATMVAGVLEAVAAVLEAFSWTGWAAAFAKYLRAVVIPWVKSAAKMLSSASQFLSLMSGKQKDASGDTPQLSSGSTPGYQVPKLPTVSTGDAPQVAAITITFGTPAATPGSTGVQVTAPSLTGGTSPVVPGQVVGSTGGGGTGSVAPVTIPAAAFTGGALGAGAVTGAALSRGFSGGSSGGSAGGSSGGFSGGSSGGTSGGSSGIGTGTRLGVADTPLGASGTGGATGSGSTTSSGLFTAPGNGSGSFDRTLPAVSSGSTDQGGGGPGAAVLAAPLGVLGLGAAAMSAHAARTATSGSTSSATQTAELDGGGAQDDRTTS